MKSIQELKEMQKQKNKLCNEINESDIYNEFEKRERAIIAGHWVDFIDDLLEYNYTNYMDRMGYTEDDIEITFTTNDPKVQKEIFITEEQARKKLKLNEEYCREHPYGVTYHGLFGGIFLEKIEIDILKWLLEIE